jgi:hypothetical protein
MKEGCGNDGLWAAEENQKQVFLRCPRALGNRWRDSHIPAAPATTAMEKWKSKSRISTFPRRLSPTQTIKKSKPKGDQPQRDTLVLQAHLTIGKRFLSA